MHMPGRWESCLDRPRTRRASDPALPSALKFRSLSTAHCSCLNASSFDSNRFVQQIVTRLIQEERNDNHLLNLTNQLSAMHHDEHDSCDYDEEDDGFGIPHDEQQDDFEDYVDEDYE